jgi:hypothetical protein
MPASSGGLGLFKEESVGAIELVDEAVGSVVPSILD